MSLDVLLLEPDTSARRKMQRVITRHHYTPLASESLDQALAVMDSATTVGVIIADVGALAGRSSKPVGAGVLNAILRKTVARLQAHAHAQHRPIPIILTGPSDDLDAHAAALTAGADVFLTDVEAARDDILGVYLQRLLERPREVPLGNSEGENGAASTVARPRIADAFELPDRDLRAESGRWDAERIAELLNVPLTRFVRALGVGYSTVAKTPDSEALQPRLAPFANVLAMLLDVYEGDVGNVRRWLRAPHEMLGDKASPLEVLLTPGGVESVEQLVSGAWLGEPT